MSFASDNGGRNTVRSSPVRDDLVEEAFAGGETLEKSCEVEIEFKPQTIQLAITNVRTRGRDFLASNLNLRCLMNRQSKLQHLLGTSDSVSCGCKQTKEDPQIDYADSIIR